MLLERFKALSDETRLRIYGVLLRHELNVNELVSVFGMGQSRVSRHLKILTDCGLLQCRKDGLWSFYSAAPEPSGNAWPELIKKEGYPRHRQDMETADRVYHRRAEDTARFFDTVAENWEQLKEELLAGSGMEERLERLIPKCDVVVDLGCGTGDLLPLLSRKAKRVIGVDNSPGMLEEARKRHHLDETRVSLRVGDLSHLPLRDEEADCAVMTMVLHHMSEPEKVLLEAAKVLKTGKTFVLIDLAKHRDEKMRSRFHDRWLGFKTGDIRSWLTRAGLDVVEEETFPLKNGLEAFALRARKKRTPSQR